MRNKRAWVIAGALLALGCNLPVSVEGQVRRTIWDGVYTDAQAQRGRVQYNSHCMICHGPDLAGNIEDLPLTGRFMADWSGTTLADLYSKISTTMPLDAPGTLSPSADADILAYILQTNNLPLGNNELASDQDLAGISFDAVKLKLAPTGKTRGR